MNTGLEATVERQDLETAVKQATKIAIAKTGGGIFTTQFGGAPIEVAAAAFMGAVMSKGEIEGIMTGAGAALIATNMAEIHLGDVSYSGPRWKKMMLVPTELHEAVKHTGGVAVIKKLK